MIEWTERLNLVMDYVEEHLKDEVEEEEVARQMGCSYASFLNSFSQISGISFLEYIRRRRLTMAAYDLQTTSKTIMDIAMDYGYQSDDAFRVAFKSLHGVTPAEVRKKNPKLVFYCRMDFEIRIRGIDQMSYTIEEKEAFDIVGVRKVTSHGGGTWEIVANDGSNDRIREVTGKGFDLGLCFGFDEEGNNDYMCAVEWSNYQGKEFEIFHYPKTTWLRFEAKGRISDQVLNSIWNKINTEFLPSSSYHKGPLPTAEHFILWNETEDTCIVEIWIPQ